jgi:hypothetical protein
MSNTVTNEVMSRIAIDEGYTSSDLILAATLIVLGEDHPVSACCEILGSGSVSGSLSTLCSSVTSSNLKELVSMGASNNNNCSHQRL